METQQGMSFLPIILVTIIFGLLNFFLAKDKGRNPKLWIWLSFIPLINPILYGYLAGCADLNLQKKLDKLNDTLDKLGINKT